MLTGVAGPDSQGLISKPLPLCPVSPAGKGYHVPQGRSLRFPAIPQHLLADTKQTRAGESILIRRVFFPPLFSHQGICLEVSSARGPIGWSYLPTSKIDQECSDMFMKTQNQLEFASNHIPVLSAIGAIGVSACVLRRGLGRRKNFEISFSEAKHEKAKTETTTCCSAE